ncbi:hypothetical protein [Streptomyces lannensis]|uniref:hypothetical protein n=1 Tax=Streptomyces TaxID=1883 RepID=UPI0031E71447
MPAEHPTAPTQAPLPPPGPIPALAAARHLAGSGTHAASLRFAEQVPFTSIHVLEAMAWPNIEWPAAYCAAIARQAAKAGDPVTVLFLDRRLYAGTGVIALNPAE